MRVDPFGRSRETAWTARRPGLGPSAVLVLACLALGGPAWGAAAKKPAPLVPSTQPTSRPAMGPPFGLKSRYATGDWFGLRPALADIGIETQYYLQDHAMSVLSGGKDRASINSGTMDWFVTADLGKMKLIPDADMLIQTRAGNGYSINAQSGTTLQQQPNDDADGFRSLYIDQLWYRQYLFNRKLAVQFGYMDFQTVVDRNAYANSEDIQFMNTALDNDPLVPTSGVTALGAAIYIQPVPWYKLILAAGDANAPTPTPPHAVYKPGFSTAFHGPAWFVGWIENDFSPKIPAPWGELPGNYRFGMLYDPRPHPIFEKTGLPQHERGHDYGFYTSFDQLLYRESMKDEQGLGWFFRYAFRHEDINRFSSFWSTGLSYTGLIPTRDKDTLGFGMTQLSSSDLYQLKKDRHAGVESVYELYYAIQVTPWFVITPDLQYIDNPGANDTISHAVVGGVRFRWSF